MSITVGSDTLHVSNVITDYVYRMSSGSFPFLSFWQFCEFTEKMSVSTETRRLENTSFRLEAQCQNHPDCKYQQAGRKAGEWGRFVDGHPKADIYMVCACTQCCVLILTGHRLPRDSSCPDAHVLWCRAMLMLFKPWRVFCDLKEDGELWMVAYERTQFGTYERQIICNLGVETEYEDAQERVVDGGGATNAGAVGAFVHSSSTEDNDSADMDSLQVSMVNSGLCDIEDNNAPDDSTACHGSAAVVDVMLALKRANLFEISPISNAATYAGPEHCSLSTFEDVTITEQHTKLMQSLKKQHHPITKGSLDVCGVPCK